MMEVAGRGVEDDEASQWASYSYVAPFLQVRRSGNGRGMFVRDRPVKKGEVLIVWTGTRGGLLF